MKPVVEVTTTGRGGGITYREGDRSIAFDWEFGMTPALALVWGPARAHWDAQVPWAPGRQKEIYEFVGAEVVRQKAPDGGYEYDLERGELTILDTTGARKQGHAAKKAAAAADELRLYVSADARLARAEEMARDGRLKSIEDILAREIRRLSQPQDGLERALRLAAAHPTATIRQALLWASYNATLCAPACAGLLLTMTGAAKEPFDADIKAMLGKLGRHTSDTARSEAFAELSKRVKMVLDQSQAD
jgi:hypothetical protein